MTKILVQNIVIVSYILSVETKICNYLSHAYNTRIDMNVVRKMLAILFASNIRKTVFIKVYTQAKSNESNAVELIRLSCVVLPTKPSMQLV